MAYTDIDKPSDYFETKLYTGTGSTQSITGLDFQPDWVWIKKRNPAIASRVYDAVRGATNTLYSSSSAAEATGQTTTLTAFNSDGFTVVSESGVNASSHTYASWNWKAGTSFTNDASATGIGTIDSTGSASDTSGFSIVSYTGTGSAGTIKHGLSTTPSMIIVKKRSSIGSFNVYHSSLGNTKAIQLDLTSPPDTNSGYWNNTSPTSSVLSLGTSAQVNGSGVTYIGYIFSEKKGYSKFGSYVGNGNANGAFVYTGFKPAMVIVKRTVGVRSWFMLDNKRNTYNPIANYLSPDSSAAEGVAEQFDFLSNGFKCRTTGTSSNGSGQSYIYMAFAENPFVTSSGVPATAR